MVPDETREVVDDFATFGVRAFTTTRQAGTFGVHGDDRVADVMGRWHALVDDLRGDAPRFATARQVHGDRVCVHGTAWEGWLRVPDADGHLAIDRGTAMAVTVADCVPVFIAHPSGALALLHSGWRGTVAGILERGLRELEQRQCRASDLRIHLGPAICGTCYEVSPDVFRELTGKPADAPTPVDLRLLLADRARALGVRHVTSSPWCTRCHNERFFSHRAGDAGRQIGVIVAEA